MLPKLNTHTHTQRLTHAFPLPANGLHYPSSSHENHSSSTGTLHSCPSLSVTLLLPSISPHPSLLRQVSSVLAYTQTSSSFRLSLLELRHKTFSGQMIRFLCFKICSLARQHHSLPLFALQCILLYFHPIPIFYFQSSPDSLNASRDRVYLMFYGVTYKVYLTQMVHRAVG